MSWSYSVPRTKAEDFAAAADEALEKARANNQLQQSSPASVEADEAAERAASIAKDLIEDGFAGSNYVSASMSGHAEPDHDSSKSTVYMTVTVYGHATQE